MKIPFECFGNENEFLQFTIGDIAEFERRMGGKSVYKMITEDEISVLHVTRGLPLCYRHNHPEMTDQEILDLLQKYIDTGGNILVVIGKFILALSQSGLFPTMQHDEVAEEEKKLSTPSQSGYPVLKR